MWKSVWTAQVMWRLIHNIIPTVENLKMKGMDLEGGCDVCGVREETVNHVMFHCKLSQDVWYRVRPTLLKYAERIAGRINF